MVAKINKNWRRWRDFLEAHTSIGKAGINFVFSNGIPGVQSKNFRRSLVMVTKWRFFLLEEEFPEGKPPDIFSNSVRVPAFRKKNCSFTFWSFSPFMGKFYNFCRKM